MVPENLPDFWREECRHLNPIEKFWSILQDKVSKAIPSTTADAGETAEEGVVQHLVGSAAEPGGENVAKYARLHRQKGDHKGK